MATTLVPPPLLSGGGGGGGATPPPLNVTVPGTRVSWMPAGRGGGHAAAAAGKACLAAVCRSAAAPALRPNSLPAATLACPAPTSRLPHVWQCACRRSSRPRPRSLPLTTQQAVELAIGEAGVEGGHCVIQLLLAAKEARVDEHAPGARLQ